MHKLRFGSYLHIKNRFNFCRNIKVVHLYSQNKIRYPCSVGSFDTELLNFTTEAIGARHISGEENLTL